MTTNNIDKEKLNQENLENKVSYSQKDLKNNVKLNTIRRTPFKSDFFIMSTKVAQSKTISLEAIGLLAYLTSLPEDWIIHKDSLHKNKPNGRDKTRNAFNELIKNKFIYSHQLYNKNIKNGIRYYVFSTPYNEESEEFKEFFRHAEFQRVDPQRAADTRLLNIDKENIYKKKESKPKKEAVASATLASEDAHVLCKYFFNKIKKEDAKAKSPNWKNWAIDMQKLIKDKRTKEEITNIIDLVFEDKFWIKNILSPKKLREKFTQLVIQFKEKIKSPFSAAPKKIENENIMLKIYDVYLNKYRTKCIGFVQEECLEYKNGYFMDRKRGENWKTHATLENLIYQLKKGNYVKKDSFENCLSIELKEALTIWKCGNIGSSQLLKN